MKVTQGRKGRAYHLIRQNGDTLAQTDYFCNKLDGINTKETSISAE